MIGKSGEVEALRIDCISTISETSSRDLAGKTVFVIDVLRSTSTMIAALASGAASIVPIETVAGAKLAAKGDDVLAGERQCRKIPGFALSNSPREFTEETVRGKRIVMTTTNGTRGIQKAAKAASVLAASMLNAGACARAALQLRRDVVLLCSGTQDGFALEDGLCAGMLMREIRGLVKEAVKADDLALALEGAYQFYSDQLEETLLACESGIRLTHMGHRGDVLYCAQRNTQSIVPVLNGGELRPFEFR
jgi:2-phosphosulfolactate phosphatase